MLAEKRSISGTAEAKRHGAAAKGYRFHGCAPALPRDDMAKAKKIAADADGNAFWAAQMLHAARKHKGSKYAIAPKIIYMLETAGQRLERDPGNAYAFAIITAAELNEVYRAEERGDDRYKKYMPLDPETGEPKAINFKSEHFCQTEIAGQVPVYETGKGAVRARIHTCGKAWTCPICAAKIAVRRNAEIRIILEKAVAEGKEPRMITLTAPHYAGRRLLRVAEKMQKAYGHFNDSWSMKNLRKDYGVIGRIKAMETLIGRNGWNNHFHVVYLFGWELSEEEAAKVLEIITEQWKKSCIYAKVLDPENEKQMAAFEAHAVNMRKEFDVSYLTKQAFEWQREHKFTVIDGEIRFSQKRKGGACTVFGRIARGARLAAMGRYTIWAMERDREILIEYGCAMHKRSMVQCSKGLKAWANLDEDKTDEEICREMEENGELLGGFDREQHAFVRAHGLWRSFKKMLKEDRAEAIEKINGIFAANGLRPFYSKKAMERLMDGAASTDSGAPKTKAFAKAGGVRSKPPLPLEQGSLF